MPKPVKTDLSATPAPDAQAPDGTLRVWDPVLRLFHWGLVFSFGLAWLTSHGSDTIHHAAGYAALALLAVRLVWGLVGPRYARFSQFVKGPGTVLAYLKDMLARREKRYLGHNPAGAAMTLALLLTLSGTAFTGWLMAEPSRLALLPTLPTIAAPAFADDGARGGRDDGVVKDVHEVLANLALLLVLAHIGGVVLTSVRHRENLPRSMVTGQKRAAGPGDIS